MQRFTEKQVFKVVLYSPFKRKEQIPKHCFYQSNVPQGTVSLGAGGVGTAILLGATVAIGATVGGGLVAVPLVAIIPVNVMLLL